MIFSIFASTACSPVLDVYKRQVYGRSQSAFSEDGLVVGAGLEDHGKGLRSQMCIRDRLFDLQD